MFRQSIAAGAAAFCLMLAACGGGGSSTPNAPSIPSPPPGSPFTAFLTSADPAPADDATISGTVPLVVHGTAMSNAELLPADGDEPKLAVMDVGQDHTRASTSFDTMKFPNGILIARIVAFDGQMGQPSSQIVVMEPRTWHISNDPAPRWVPIPPASVMPEVECREEDLPYVDPAAIDEWLQLTDAVFQDRIANDWDSFVGMYRRYIPEHVRLYAASPGQVIAQESCIKGIVSDDYTLEMKAASCRSRLQHIRKLMNAVPR